MSDSARAIAVQSLTHCDVCCSGRHVEIGFTDHRGTSGVLYLSHESLSALLLSLTAAVEEANERRTGTVQPVRALADWGLAANGEDQSIILTLRATDGFDVSFSADVPIAAALGEALKNAGAPAPAKPAPLARLCLA
jgi:hypothetical protein